MAKRPPKWPAPDETRIELRIASTIGPRVNFQFSGTIYGPRDDVQNLCDEFLVKLLTLSKQHARSSP